MSDPEKRPVGISEVKSCENNVICVVQGSPMISLHADVIQKKAFYQTESDFDCNTRYMSFNPFFEPAETGVRIVYTIILS